MKSLLLLVISIVSLITAQGTETPLPPSNSPPPATMASPIIIPAPLPPIAPPSPPVTTPPVTTPPVTTPPVTTPPYVTPPVALPPVVSNPTTPTPPTSPPVTSTVIRTTTLPIPTSIPSVSVTTNSLGITFTPFITRTTTLSVSFSSTSAIIPTVSSQPTDLTIFSSAAFTTILSTISNPTQSLTTSAVVPIVSTLSTSVVLGTTISASSGTSNQVVTISGTLSTRPSTTATSNGFIPQATVSPIVQIQLPVLTQCDWSSFDFVGPPLAKYLGVFTKGSSRFIETYNLPDSYTPMTNGSFTFHCDLPAGLSVGVMFYVLIDNNIPPGGSATTPYGVIQPGKTWDCIARNNDQVNTSAVVSYASSLNPAWIYVGPTSTANSSGVVIAEPIHFNPVAAIVGGVLGAIALFALGATAFYFLYKKRHEPALLDDDSTFAGTIGTTGSEKYGSFYQPSQYPSPAFDQNQMNYGTQGGVDGFGRPMSDSSRYSGYTSNQTAQPGTLPEPMDADESPELYSPNSPTLRSGSVSPTSAFNQTGGPSSTDRVRSFGHHGLDDPTSFASDRRENNFNSNNQVPMMLNEDE